jgi:hypothetical protein
MRRFSAVQAFVLKFEGNDVGLSRAHSHWPFPSDASCYICVLPAMQLFRQMSDGTAGVLSRCVRVDRV